MGVSKGGGVRAGTIDWFAASTPPAGYIKANGAAVSRTIYGALFSVIGTTYGVGDGSTTFNVPDLRGEFIRGLDDGRGVDVGRGIGTAQVDAFKSHSHGVGEATTNAGNSTYPATGYMGGTAAEYNNSAATGDTETRPRNVAMLPCIKF